MDLPFIFDRILRVSRLQLYISISIFLLLPHALSHSLPATRPSFCVSECDNIAIPYNQSNPAQSLVKSCRRCSISGNSHGLRKLQKIGSQLGCSIFPAKTRLAFAKGLRLLGYPGRRGLSLFLCLSLPMGIFTFVEHNGLDYDALQTYNQLALFQASRSGYVGRMLALLPGGN